MSGSSESVAQWVDATGNDIFDLIRGVSYNKGDARSAAEVGYVPILRANNIADGQIVPDDLVYVPARYVSPEQFLQPGDVLIAASSGSRSVVGKAAQANADHKRFAFGAFCAVARPKVREFGDWLALFTRTHQYREYVESVALGININNFRGSDFKAMPVPLAPQFEQRRIVAKIDSLSGKSKRAHNHLDHVQRLVEKYKLAVLSVAFTGELTKAWRNQRACNLDASEFVRSRDCDSQYRLEMHREGRDERTALLSLDNDLRDSLAEEASMSPLPTGWCWAALGQVFGVYVGATPSRKEAAYWGGDIPWVSSGEVAFCRIHDTAEKITELGLRNASTRVHPVGTVLIGMIGEGKTRGQAAILDTPACNNQNSAAIRVSEAGYSPEYVYLYLQSSYETTRGSGAGNNQPALNKSRVQRLLIPLAPPEEASEIVRVVSAAFAWIDRLASEATSARKLIDHLDQAILSKAFRGELVPQDPNDEPVSMLLARIRTGKVKEPGSRKARKRTKA